LCGVESELRVFSSVQRENDGFQTVSRYHEGILKPFKMVNEHRTVQKDPPRTLGTRINCESGTGLGG
jgi:hypothetical protein